MANVKYNKKRADKILEIGIKYHLEGDIYKAEKYYKRFLDSGFINPNALSNYGVICRQTNRKKKAIELYKRAIKLFPKKPEAFSNLGSLLLELNKTNKAEFYLRKAIQINPNFANANFNLGSALKDLRRFKEAEFYTRKAIKLKPNEAKAHSNLGSILKSIGKLQEAKSSIRKAIKIDKDLVTPYFVLSLLETETENKEWYKYLFSKKILENKSKEDQINIYFARSNIMHKRKEYQESAKNLQAANAIKISLYPSDFNYISEKSKNLLDETEKYKIEKNTKNSQQELIFIVGMPRSGSTLIESIISMNEEVKDLGEVNYLEDAYLEWIKNKNKNFKTIYISKLPEGSEKEKITTNKWLYNYQYAGIIAKCLPKAKIIHCIRNPFDNILSIYRAHFAIGNRYSSSLKDTAKLYLEEKKIMFAYQKKYSDKIYQLNYESIILNTESTIKQLINWLGWEWETKYLSPELNLRSISTASSVQVRSPINNKSINSWKNYETLLLPAIEIISKNKEIRNKNNKN
tara:strand:- start:382 stop:1935 length:1554 start_codon:yes stop_codon:yes gene_type:complete